jgi:hypothetical protein
MTQQGSPPSSISSSSLKQMRLSHLYQPLMPWKLIENGVTAGIGSCSWVVRTLH